MGLRFRKSFKVAPGVKFNINKKSVGVSVGTRGAHYTVNSSGKKTKSVGIPGTGLSYTTSSGGNDPHKKSSSRRSSSVSPEPDHNQHNKHWYEKTGWIIALLILFFPVGLFFMWRYANWKNPIKIIISVIFGIFVISGFSSDRLKTIEISADTALVYDIGDIVPISVSTDPLNYDIPDNDFKSSGGSFNNDSDSVSFCSDKAGDFNVYIYSSGIKSNVITIKVEDKAAIAKEEQRLAAEAKAQDEAAQVAAAEAQAQEEAAQVASAESQVQEEFVEEAQIEQPQEQMVWISATGSKYHSTSNCGKMNPSNASQITLSDAQGLGLEPCQKCY